MGDIPQGGRQQQPGSGPNAGLMGDMPNDRFAQRERLRQIT